MNTGIKFVARGFVGRFEGTSTANLLSRSRVAYLIRAARSRRAFNVKPYGNGGYQLVDCQYLIIRTRVAVLNS